MPEACILHTQSLTVREKLRSPNLLGMPRLASARVVPSVEVGALTVLSAASPAFDLSVRGGVGDEQYFATLPSCCQAASKIPRLGSTRGGRVPCLWPPYS